MTARVTKAAIVDSTTLGMAPPQPLCVLSLDVTAVRTASNTLPAIPATDKSALVYSKDTALARLEGRVITAAITLRADERGGRLWLIRLDDPKAP